MIGDQCAAFATQNPCITPYSNTGPHSEECLKTLWRNSGCTGEYPYNKTFTQLKKDLSSISVGEISQAFKKLYTDTIPTDDLGKAMVANEQCFNKPRDGLDPCDRKFVGTELNDKTKIAREMCAKQIWKQKGGTTMGESYFDKLKENFESQTYILEMDKDRYTKEVDNLKKTADQKHVSANDFPEKNRASLALYGKPADAGAGIQPGDYIKMHWPGKGYDSFLYGYVIEKNSKTKNWNVLWVIRQINKDSQEERKTSMPLNEQREKFGWNGIKASGDDMIKVGEDESGGLSGRSFIVLKKCTPGFSLCGNSCGELIYRLLDQYPRPQDCVVGEWGAYSKCDAECGPGGRKTRTRKILYPARKGGLPCPALSDTITCTGPPCVNKNFRKSNNVTILGTIDKVNYVEIRHDTTIHIRGIEVYNEYGQNVALKSKGAVATVSEQTNNGNKDAPIDGDNSPKPYKGGSPNPSCCHTKANKPGYWRVKLQPNSNDGFHTISRVVIYNRPDCCQSVLKGAQLRLLSVSSIDSVENVVEVRTLNEKDKQVYNYGTSRDVSCLKLDYKSPPPKKINRIITVGSVGNGSRHTSRYKTVTLPYSGMTVQGGRGYGSPHGDRFSTSVSGKRLTVKRLDRPHGWGQNLRLKATGSQPPPAPPPACTSKSFKPSESSQMNNFKNQCTRSGGKVAQGDCVSSMFELSPYYSQKTSDGKYWKGGDLVKGYISTKSKSAEDCAIDCAKNKKCKRFSFGINGLGCRISDGSYNNGKSPSSHTITKEVGKVYDRKSIR